MQYAGEAAVKGMTARPPRPPDRCGTCRDAAMLRRRAPPRTP